MTTWPKRFGDSVVEIEERTKENGDVLYTCKLDNLKNIINMICGDPSCCIPEVPEGARVLVKIPKYAFDNPMDLFLDISKEFPLYISWEVSRDVFGDNNKK